MILLKATAFFRRQRLGKGVPKPLRLASTLPKQLDEPSHLDGVSLGTKRDDDLIILLLLLLCLPWFVKYKDHFSPSTVLSPLFLLMSCQPFTPIPPPSSSPLA